MTERELRLNAQPVMLYMKRYHFLSLSLPHFLFFPLLYKPGPQVYLENPTVSTAGSGHAAMTLSISPNEK